MLEEDSEASPQRNPINDNNEQQKAPFNLVEADKKDQLNDSNEDYDDDDFAE